MAGQLVRSITITVVLLLGVVAGAYLSLIAAYMALEPAERSAFNVLLVVVLVALLGGLALVARKASGSLGLVCFAFVALLGVVSGGLVIL